MKPNLFALLLLASPLAAQNTLAPRFNTDFTTQPDGDGQRFVAQLPPLPAPIPGAPEPYYTYHWEFGDGSRSTAESPVHHYLAAGDYEAVLTATLHYDDGKLPKKKKKRVAATAAAYTEAPGLPNTMRNSRKSVVLAAVREPRPDEELTLVLAYRNQGSVATGGQLHLFFNEKVFKTRHFEFEEARTHFGETAAPRYSDGPFLQENPAEWATATGRQPTWLRSQNALELPTEYGPLQLPTAHCNGPLPEGLIADEMLASARRTYRDEQVWQFGDLRPGAARQLFVTLLATAQMLRDTSAFVHVHAVFVPDQPQVAPEEYRLEMEVVASHDPNLIAVSDHRVNYRHVGRAPLDYKVRFQNNGENAAKKIELAVDLPPGLPAEKIQPLEWYPTCPICPPQGEPTRCLDTTRTDHGVVFTFHGVYLPGSKQRGVADFDSTKGFVRYRVVPEKGLPKHSFKSRASIVFDKNPPVTTNYTATRFKIGSSPVLKAGWSAPAAFDSLSSGYFFLGAGWAPYRSWRWYPQVELLTGLRGRQLEADVVTDGPPTDLNVKQQVVVLVGSNGTVQDARKVDSTYTVVRTTRRAERGLVSFEVPISLQKSVTSWFGVGVGASARVVLNNGSDLLQTQKFSVAASDTIGFVAPQQSLGYGRTVVSEGTGSMSQTYRSRQVWWAVFAEIQLGAVRAGPHLSLRGGTTLGDSRRAFVQLSAVYKL